MSRETAHLLYILHFDLDVPTCPAFNRGEWKINVSWVKVGTTADTLSLPIRVNTLQCGNPFKIRHAYVAEGYPTAERDAHAALAEFRVNREWFAGLTLEEFKRRIEITCPRLTFFPTVGPGSEAEHRRYVAECKKVAIKEVDAIINEVNHGEI